MKRFYGHFAAAYGTCWFTFWIVALLLRTDITLGWIGFFGFPIVGLVWALYRGGQESSTELARLRLAVERLEARLGSDR